MRRNRKAAAPSRGYEYQRKEGSGSYGGWTTAETVTFGTNSHTAILRDATTLDHYDVKAETTYTYRVRAVNAGGGGDASAEDSATTGAAMTVKVVVAEPKVFEDEGPVRVMVVAELPATGPNTEKYELEFRIDVVQRETTRRLLNDDFTPLSTGEFPIFTPSDFNRRTSGRWVASKAVHGRARRRRLIRAGRDLHGGRREDRLRRRG